ncbi:hypothetical protein EIP91_004868 [Steccherinum ochraceum]|uniref:RING-type domain-containing protein n=1 Tax=Steccherinum ochraceum TaxID=92696 RepID=A0A4R0RND1_9APHY|nr:hypothetical protein EIP91_004868 [Steccherinum ochraceum]
MLQEFSWDRYAEQYLAPFVPIPSYQCPITGCRERFPSLPSLTAHCASEHYTILPTCNKCGKAFIAEMYLKAHLQAKHPRELSYQKCSRVFAEGSAMAMHQWMAHPGSRCEPCGEYIYQEDMARHLLDSPNHPKCTICNWGFGNTGSLYDHMAQIHPELCCSLCHMIFTTTEHLREHHRTTRRHSSCIHCNVGFSSDVFLKKHNALMHSSSGTGIISDGEDSDTLTISSSSSRTSSPKSCSLKMSSVCSARSSVPSSPKKRPKGPRPVKMVECNVCNIRFSRKSKLAKHYYKSSKHPVCAPCDVGFEDEPTYHAHVAKTHPPLYEPSPTPIPDTPTPSVINLPLHTVTPPQPPPSWARIQPESPVSSASSLPPVDAITQRSRSPSNPSPPSSVAIRMPGSPAAIHVPLCSKSPTPRLRPDLSRATTPSVSSDPGSSSEDVGSVLSGETAVASPSPDIPPAIPPSCSRTTSCDNYSSHEQAAPSEPPSASPAASVPCRMCLQPSSDPIVTICGHVFCHKCIMTEIAKNLQCPVCKKIMFVRLDLGTA